MMKLLRQVAQCALLLTATIGLATGCQTNGKDGDSGKMMPAAQIPFYPQVSKVNVRAGEGNYPNLFTGATYAVWGGATMAEPATAEPAMMDGAQKAETMETHADGKAQESGENGSTEVMMASDEKSDNQAMAPAIAPARSPGQPLLIECYLESEFPDMSIAYDSVGLRGVQFFLSLPGGGEILPVQKTLDSNLSETAVGALRRFGRKVTLYFPTSSIVVDNPAVSPDSQGVRLVFEAHETRFYFEWPTTPDFSGRTKKPGLDKKALEAGDTVYRSVSKQTKRISHEFD